MSIPKHIAIIMDGNGRWAQRRGHPRVFGHIRGSSRIKPIVREADRLGVRALTFYAFSTENWARPEHELWVLWRLIKKYLMREISELEARNVRLRVIGEVERLSPDVRQVLNAATERLKDGTGLQLTLAISYGSRAELVQAAKIFAEECVSGKRKPSDMDEGLMERYLWTADLGPLSQVDLVIRTSGEQRVSNFLLWQAAYAEFVFVSKCWPDFALEDFKAALEEYSLRERRFGGIRNENRNEAPEYHA